MNQKQFEFLSEEDILALPDPVWLVEDIIPEKAFLVLVAPPGTGKTFIVLSMLYALRYGHPWLGQPVSNAVSVLYAYGEGGAGLKNRIPPLLIDSCNPSPIYFLNGLPSLTSEADVVTFIRQVNSLSPKPQLIVLDTLARAFVGGDENNARDMGQLVAGVSRIIKETGATVFLLHHTTKNTGKMRGSSALEGAADVIMELYGKGRDVCLSCSKMKDAEPFKDVQIVLTTFELENGKTTLLPILETDPRRIKARSSKNGGERAALENHIEAIWDFVKAGMPNGLKNRDIFKLFSEQKLGSKPTFNRAMKDINERQLLSREVVGREVIYRIPPEK